MHSEAFGRRVSEQRKIKRRPIIVLWAVELIRRSCFAFRDIFNHNFGVKLNSWSSRNRPARFVSELFKVDKEKVCLKSAEIYFNVFNWTKWRLRISWSSLRPSLLKIVEQKKKSATALLMWLALCLLNDQWNKIHKI